MIRKIKKLALPLAAIFISLSSIPIPLFYHYAESWPQRILVAIIEAVALYLLMSLIRTALVLSRIRKANTEGMLEHWLAQRGFLTEGPPGPSRMAALLLAVRDDPRASEDDRKYAAFLTATPFPLTKKDIGKLRV